MQPTTMSIETRRNLVIAMYGSYAASVVLRLLGEKWLAMAGLVAMLLTVAALWRLFHQTPYWFWGNQPDEKLDERERLTRDRCYRQSYIAFVSATLLSLIYASIAVDHPALWLPRSYNELTMVVWGAMLAGLTLPSALLAWQDSPVADE